MIPPSSSATSATTLLFLLVHVLVVLPAASSSYSSCFFKSVTSVNPVYQIQMSLLQLLPLRVWGSRICPTTRCECHQEATKQFRTTSARQGCSNLPTHPTPAGYPRIQKSPPTYTPLVGAQGYPRFPLSKPVMVSLNIALHAVSAYGAST